MDYLAAPGSDAWTLDSILFADRHDLGRPTFDDLHAGHRANGYRSISTQTGW